MSHGGCLCTSIGQFAESTALIPPNSIPLGPLRRFKTGTGVANTPGEGGAMWTIFVILVIMWLLGMVSSYTLGGFLHLLLILAIAIVLIRIIQGRRPI